MNQLINLSGDYVTFDINNKNQKVKIVGTFKQPYFCGRDVCEILGYVDVYQALHKHVKPKNKKDLKTLNDEFPVGSTGNFFGSEHLKNITYHSGKAVAFLLNVLSIFKSSKGYKMFTLIKSIIVWSILIISG